jgi:hypothetical protein
MAGVVNSAAGALLPPRSNGSKQQALHHGRDGRWIQRVMVGQDVIEQALQTGALFRLADLHWYRPAL